MASAGSAVAGAAVATGLCLLTSPYLARLTRTVPDRANPRWWTARPPTTTRTVRKPGKPRTTGTARLAATADRRVWVRAAAVERTRLLTTAATGTVFGALAGLAAGWGALLPAFAALALIATPLVIIDVDHHRLPNRLVYPATAAAAVLLALAAGVRHDWSDYLRALEAAAAVYVVLLALRLASPRSFGRGDVRLGAVLAAYLGYASWGTVFAGLATAFVVGAVVAVALMAAGRAGRRTAMAFGPMLVLGSLVALAADLSRLS